VIFNLPAFAVVAVLTVIPRAIGVKESANSNNVDGAAEDRHHHLLPVRRRVPDPAENYNEPGDRRLRA
jgi:hypothetical protein